MIFDKIFRRRRGALLVCLGLAILFVLSAAPGDISYAKGRIMREEWKVPNFYPRGFDGYGKIEVIERNRIVVDDSAFEFSRHVQFATPRDRNAGIYDFSVGDTVAFLLNEKREIVSLWYIEFR
ncbi:MAG: hypothetical protein JRF38_19105 [Deltaproteobacteria bacterium]|jgi:hypothetical protein|nr:hypothetical protein [Deltaproteobacteria bacterium]